MPGGMGNGPWGMPMAGDCGAAAAGGPHCGGQGFNFYFSADFWELGARL